ncbi:UvrB/UvrC motif-containing protein, partial [Escherichia coli]|uniref:UvrB/UvrC motif-containing protein n=1 Tax=Escherichia coli TaxID=562 RepID=UPI001965F756
FLPDKAIDLIDEAGARLRIQKMTPPAELKEYDAKIEDVRREKESAIDSQDFEGAASLRDKEQSLIDERNDKEEAWKTGSMD